LSSSNHDAYQISGCRGIDSRLGGLRHSKYYVAAGIHGAVGQGVEQAETRGNSAAGAIARRGSIQPHTL